MSIFLLTQTGLNIVKGFSEQSLLCGNIVLYYVIMEIDGNPEENLLDIPILGKPKYQWGDMVEWAWGPNGKKTGKVEIVDAYGTFEQNIEPSYDIFVEEENCLYKHICESEILRKVKE